MRRLILVLVVGFAGCKGDPHELFAPPNLYPPSQDLGVSDDLLPLPDLSVVSHPDLSHQDLSQLVVSQSDLSQLPDLQQPDLLLPDLYSPPDLTVDPTDDVHHLAGVDVTTFAGSDEPGTQDGPNGTARFNNPTGLALDDFGNLYVAEYDGSRIRRLDSAGNSGTVLVDQLGFSSPFGLAISGFDLYVETDDSPIGVRDETSGTLWRWHLWGGAAEVVLDSQDRPRGLATMADGTLIFADRARYIVSQLPPSAPPSLLAGGDGEADYVDAIGDQARFAEPYGVAVLSDGSVLVADAANHVIRRIAADGTVTTFAGDGTAGSVDGPRLSARFRGPRDVATDSSDNIYISDPEAHYLRRIRCMDGEVETLAGDGFAGFADGPGETAEFYGLESLVATPDGSIVFVSDGNQGDGSRHHRVRKLTIP